MNITQKTLFQRIFHIYPEERKQAFLFAVLGFLWAFGASSGLKFADALFLIHIGAESLPQAYMLIACGMLCISSILFYVFHRFSCYVIYLSTLLIGISFYFFALFCRFAEVDAHSQWFWYALNFLVFSCLPF